MILAARPYCFLAPGTAMVSGTQLTMQPAGGAVVVQPEIDTQVAKATALVCCGLISLLITIGTAFSLSFVSTYHFACLAHGRAQMQPR